MKPIKIAYPALTSETRENYDQFITRQTSEATPLSVALFAACSWLKKRPELTADPDILLEFVSAWLVVAGPVTPEEARECGIHAVKEVAGCRKDSPLHEPEIINPEDLID